MAKQKKRLGRIMIAHHYVVDLNNELMIQEAKNALFEDLMNAVKYDELGDWIDTQEDPNAREEEIAEFLTDDQE